MPTAPVPAPPARGGLRVSSVGATRRLQALHHLGYDAEFLAPQLRWPVTVLDQLLTTPPQTILATSQKRVIDVFKQFRAIPAELELDRVSAAKNRADDNGWAGPFDWEDIDTDERPHARRRTHAGEDIESDSDEELDVIDQTTAASKPKRTTLTAAIPTDVETPLLPQEEPTADVHEGMTERQMVSHYDRGCRETPCREAKARKNKIYQLAAKKRREAATASGGDQGSASPTGEDTPASSRVGDTGDSVSEPGPVVHSAPAPPELNTEAEAATLRPVEPPPVDPRDEQLILLVVEVGELERVNATLTEQLERAQQVVADELDLRTTMQAQIRNLTEERDIAMGAIRSTPVFTVPDRPAPGPSVTVHVYIGGQEVA